MITEQEFQELQNRVALLREKRSRAKGAYDSKMKELRQQFNVKSIEEGDALVAKFEQEAIEAEEAFEAAHAQFIEDWKHVL